MSGDLAPRIRIHGAAAALVVLTGLALSGCGGGDQAAAEVAGGTRSGAQSADSDAAPDEATSPAAPEPAARPDGSSEQDASEPQDAPSPAQEETCDWESPAISAAAEAPDGQTGDLSTVLVGAWQHTHFDTGSGYEAVTKDIRYVFPSTERILYCQHVPGVTDHAENAVDFVLDGFAIDLPGGAPGYVVSDWDADTMVWINRADESRYLLQRR